MQHGDVIREYAAGDEIRIKLRVEHAFRLRDVTARLEGPDGRTHIELLGRQIQKVSVVDRLDGTTSEVTLSTEVTADNMLGVYRLVNIESDYRGGRRIEFDLGDSLDVRVRVVEEPVERPNVTKAEVLG